MLSSSSASGGGSSKRLRSWDIDVSLDELVSWDMLDQFMQEIPFDAGAPAPSASDKPSESISPHLGASTSPYGCGASPLHANADGAFWQHSEAFTLPARHAQGPLVPFIPREEGRDPRENMLSSQGQGPYNAASLAQSLYPTWQQAGSSHCSLPSLMCAPWGSDLLPTVLASEEATKRDHSLESPSASVTDDLADSSSNQGRQEGTSISSGRPAHKQRFVWTAELHRRFEAAVNTLGIDHAKPQAISQLMNCQGEGAPTRQNIKSHLQKYRLLMQKRAKQPGEQPVAEAPPEGQGSEPEKVPEGSSGISANAAVPATPDVQNELEQHLARQEMNLKVQMELQTKLHRQLLVQRQLQHQLEHSFQTSEQFEESDRQRWEQTLTLKKNLRERLTKHVHMQQEMLHHLDTLVTNETKPSAGAETTTSTWDTIEDQPPKPAAAESTACSIPHDEGQLISQPATHGSGNGSVLDHATDSLDAKRGWDGG